MWLELPEKPDLALTNDLKPSGVYVSGKTGECEAEFLNSRNGYVAGRCSRQSGQ